MIQDLTGNPPCHCHEQQQPALGFVETNPRFELPELDWKLVAIIALIAYVAWREYFSDKAKTGLSRKARRIADRLDESKW